MRSPDQLTGINGSQGFRAVRLQTVGRSSLHKELTNRIGPLSWNIALYLARNSSPCGVDQSPDSLEIAPARDPLSKLRYEGCQIVSNGTTLSEEQLLGRSELPDSLKEHVGDDVGELKVAHLMGAPWELQLNFVHTGALNTPYGDKASDSIVIPFGRAGEPVGYEGRSAGETLRRSYAYAMVGVLAVMLGVVLAVKGVTGLLLPSGANPMTLDAASRKPEASQSDNDDDSTGASSTSSDPDGAINHRSSSDGSARQ